MNIPKKPLIAVIIFLSLAGFLIFTGDRWSRNQRIASLENECPAAAAASDWRRLQKLSSEWLDALPTNPHARYWQGEALQQQGRYDEAMQNFEQLRVDEPRGIDAAIRKMHIELFIRNKPSDALHTASELLEEDATLAEPIRLRIYYFAMTFQRANLIQEIDLAIQCRADLPEHFVYLVLLEDLSFRDGANIVERWLQNDESLQDMLSDSLFIHTILNEREAAIRESNASVTPDLASIRRKCVEKVQSRKESAAILELAIRLELESGNNLLVGDLLEQVPESVTNDPLFWIHRGKFALDQQNVVDARLSFERAIELHPIAWRTRGHLATVNRLEGNVESAKKNQEFAAKGATVAKACLSLNSSRDVSQSTLREIADFARACGANKIATAIDRRNM